MYDWFTWLDSLPTEPHCSKCHKLLDRNTVEAGHITPMAKGGTNTIDNLVPLCKDCFKEQEY